MRTREDEGRREATKDNERRRDTTRGDEEGRGKTKEDEGTRKGTRREDEGGRRTREKEMVWMMSIAGWLNLIANRKPKKHKQKKPKTQAKTPKS